jgi:hypothetical protein
MNNLQKLFGTVTKQIFVATAALSTLVATPALAQKDFFPPLNGNDPDSFAAPSVKSKSAVIGKQIAPAFFTTSLLTMDNERGCLADFGAKQHLKSGRAHSHYLVCATFTQVDPDSPNVTTETTEFEVGSLDIVDGKHAKNYALLSVVREVTTDPRPNQRVPDVLSVAEETRMVFVLGNGRNWYGENFGMVISGRLPLAQHKDYYICTNEYLVPCAGKFDNEPTLSPPDRAVQQQMTKAAFYAERLVGAQMQFAFH